MKNNIQQNSRWGMASEQMKYAEVQAVAGGVTAIQGSPGSGTSAWDSMLARNVELYNFGQDGISTCAVCGAAVLLFSYINRCISLRFDAV